MRQDKGGFDHQKNDNVVGSGAIIAREVLRGGRRDILIFLRGGS